MAKKPSASKAAKPAPAPKAQKPAKAAKTAPAPKAQKPAKPAPTQAQEAAAARRESENRAANIAASMSRSPRKYGID